LQHFVREAGSHHEWSAASQCRRLNKWNIIALSGSWDTPVKEIIESAIVKDPTLRGEVTCLPI
jgi:hypothetical protein